MMRYVKSINELFGYDIDASIKKFLINKNNFENWEEFIDNQEKFKSKSIVDDIVCNFPQVKKVLGYIEVDHNYYDEGGDEQDMMIHYWVEINGIYFDYSKGTLKGYINWIDMYDYSIHGEEWRYNEL